MDVTTWYLEQTSRADLRPARPPREPVQIVRAEIPSPEFSRFLYTAVGGDWHWTQRLSWTWREWRDWLSPPGGETRGAWLRGTPAGDAEPGAQEDRPAEGPRFGLLRPPRRRGPGGPPPSRGA